MQSTNKAVLDLPESSEVLPLRTMGSKERVQFA